MNCQLSYKQQKLFQLKLKLQIADSCQNVRGSWSVNCWVKAESSWRVILKSKRWKQLKCLFNSKLWKHLKFQLKLKLRNGKQLNCLHLNTSPDFPSAWGLVDNDWIFTFVVRCVCVCVCVGGSCESRRGLPAAAQHAVSHPVVFSESSATAQRYCGVTAPTDRPAGTHTITVCVGSYLPREWIVATLPFHPGLSLGQNFNFNDQKPAKLLIFPSASPALNASANQLTC